MGFNSFFQLNALFFFIKFIVKSNLIISFMSCLFTLTVFYILFVFAPFVCANTTEWIQYPDAGTATMTHYSLPQDYIASCGCTGQSTHFPTAALNQMAYGSSTAYGPSCGRCFKLTLLNTFLSDPPFYPTVTKSLVVKITDLCPRSVTGWCNATTSGPNALVILCRCCTWRVLCLWRNYSAGNYLNFDLAFPSSSIPDNFFPSNVSLYGE